MADTANPAAVYGVAGQVNDQFAKSHDYATKAYVQMGTFATALENAVYSAPSISVTWNSLTPPAAMVLPTHDAMPTIAVSMPTDTPAALDVGAPTVSIDNFTDTMDTLDFGTKPTISYGTVPAVPSIDAVAIPTADTVVMPDAPTYLALNTVSFSGVDLHPDWLLNLETIPAMTLVEPTPFSYARGPEYASALLADLKAKLVERLSGGTGLSPAVEQAIWDRARSRETNTALANEAEIMRQSEAFGFSLPSGTLAAQLREAQQDYYDKLSTLSRDVAIKQAELEQENLKQTIAEGMQLESKLIDTSLQLERLAFDASKQYADNAIQIYNAGVEGYKALLTGYQTYATAYKTIIDAELAKVEVYKAELQAEMTKAQINTAKVEQYKAAISAQMSKVEIYKAQVSAAQTLVQLESTKVQAAGEQVKAYVAQINAETAKVEAYKAGVTAEATKAEVFKTKVQAYSAKVGAQGEKARADLGRYTALVQAKTAEWDGFKAKVQAEAERVRALGLQSSSMLDGYKASVAALEAEANMRTKIWETQIKDYEAAQNITLQTAKINTDAIMQTNQAKLEASKVGAQVYAQLTASAYGMAHATASMSGSVSNGVSYSYSNDTSAAATTQAWAW